MAVRWRKMGEGDILSERAVWGDAGRLMMVFSDTKEEEKQHDQGEALGDSLEFVALCDNVEGGAVRLTGIMQTEFPLVPNEYNTTSGVCKLKYRHF